MKVKVKSSINSVPRFFFPTYSGPSNAFIVDFFAIDTNKLDEKLSSFDFLEAAFRSIPDRDYCILNISTDFLPFPLLKLFTVSMKQFQTQNFIF